MENASVTATRFIFCTPIVSIVEYICYNRHCYRVTWHLTVKNTAYEVAPSLLFLIKY